MRKIHAETMSTHEPDPHEELAIGIIRQAADDYRRLCQKKQKTLMCKLKLMRSNNKFS